MNKFLQKIGAWHAPSLSEFIVWAPLRQQVELIIESPADPHQVRAEEKISVHPIVKAYPMIKDEWGYWRTAIPAAAGTTYRFRLDGGNPFPDPASISQPDGVHGPSQLLDREGFSWDDDAWGGLPLGNMIIYEMHTGVFSRTHDFEGIIQKLDYLLRLGVNTIELMPLAQFPGERNWGYDGVYPFAVQHSYGGAQGLKRLVNAAHAKGIAVIVDVVYNHLGPEGNHLQEFGPYFTDKYHTPWGKALNFDDAWCDGVRNYFLQNARMWLEDFHVDGLRLDAVHAIVDCSANPFIRQLKEQAVEISEVTGCQKAIIAEIDLNDTKYINPTEKGGYGLDGQWCDEFHHSLHSLLTGERNGYYEDFGTIGHLEKAFRDTYVYNGNYSVHRKRLFGTHAGNNPFSQFVVFAQNHDQVGNRAGGDRLTATLSLEQLKLAAATVLLSPYIPLLFMGEEYGEKNPFLFFTSFSNPVLIEAVRKGRKEEFRHAGDDLPDPQDSGAFERSLLSWHDQDGTEAVVDGAGAVIDRTGAVVDGARAVVDGAGAVLFGFYQSLIAFRKTRPAMQGMTRDSLLVHPANDHVLAFERKILNDHLFIWLNFNDREMSVPNRGAGILSRVFDSAATACPEFGESTPCRDEIAPGGTIRLAPFSATVFENKRQIS